MALKLAVSTISLWRQFQKLPPQQAQIAQRHMALWAHHLAREAVAPHRQPLFEPY